MSSTGSNMMNQNEELYLARSKFDSYDDLLRNVRAFYYAKGYGISIRDSRKDKYVTLQCALSGIYKEQPQKKRKRCAETKKKKSTGSRLTNCPFQIAGKKGSDGLWALSPNNLTHNHEPANDMSGLPSSRRLPPEDVQTVKHMTLSGIPPRQIISSLRQQNPNLPANSRTIYNLKAKIRKDDLKDRSMVSALFEELGKGGFTYDISHDTEGHINRLFIAHPLSIKLAKAFSNTFVMDFTYKTNRYNMPLLDIIGISCFNTSFYSGFVFLEKENEENYKWAITAFKNILGQGNHPSVIVTDRELALMNVIEEEFPATTSLLCVWHIEKNVVANCKKLFERSEDYNMFMSSWNNVVYSTTETLFEQNWSEFALSYNENKDAVEYVKKNWLPWKEKFISAWTEKYLHFGNRSSSRAEGAHAKLKKYLQVSTGDFKKVNENICLAVKHEFNEMKVKLAYERLQVPHNCNMPLFKELLSQVSQFALNKIHEQYEKVKAGTMRPCTVHFTGTMGLPCAHKIKSLLRTTLSLDLVHPQWRIGALSLNPKDNLPNDDANKFSKLLSELGLKYQEWSLSKKEFATSMITKLVNQNDIFFEPVIQRPKGRPPKSKKKKGITSTTRDPSRFEYVESTKTDYPLSSTSRQHENNFIDLNVFPDF